LRPKHESFFVVASELGTLWRRPRPQGSGAAVPLSSAGSPWGQMDILAPGRVCSKPFSFHRGLVIGSVANELEPRRCGPGGEPVNQLSQHCSFLKAGGLRRLIGGFRRLIGGTAAAGL
jgi:hypothetical protein